MALPVGIIVNQPGIPYAITNIRHLRSTERATRQIPANIPQPALDPVAGD